MYEMYTFALHTTKKCSGTPCGCQALHNERTEYMQIQQKEIYQHNVYPDERGRFGAFGGKFVPESLMAALAELETAYQRSLADTAFQTELQRQLHSFVGRPTMLHYVPRFSAKVASNVKVYLKREDL